MSSKESDLITAAFLFISRAIAEGDTDALRTMQLGAAEIQLFRQLRLDDLQRLSSHQLPRHFLDISWKSEALWHAYHYVVELRQDHETKLALIEADAPQALMTLLYGMTKNEYAGYRLQLGLNYAGGRPARPDDTVCQQIWSIWQQMAKNRTYDELSAEEYLQFHRETNLPLRIIWSLLVSWCEDKPSLLALPKAV